MSADGALQTRPVALARRTWPSPWEFWTRAGALLAGHWVFSSQRRAARVLFGFARAEEQSQIELRAAARSVTRPELKVAYLRHALDEARHARVFCTLARELQWTSTGQGLPRPTADSEDLFERLGEARFLAFVHLGERRGRVQFEVYARVLRWRGDERLARAFETIVRDELRHERYTRALLVDRFGSAAAGRALAWARSWEAWQSFRRAGSAAGRWTYALFMGSLYVVLFPLALWFRAQRPAARGFRAGE